jgi:hypothetical protein
MNENQKEKLEFQINIPTQVKLLQSQPATGTSQYGPWWLYNVESDGKEYSMFTPDAVEKFIETEKLGKGDVLEITKTVTKYGNKKLTDYKCSLVEKAKIPPAPANNTNGTNGTNYTNGKTDDYQLMLASMRQALQIQQELGAVIDVNRVGISLYISKSKNGNYQF